MFCYRLWYGNPIEVFCVNSHSKGNKCKYIIHSCKFLVHVLPNHKRSSCIACLSMCHPCVAREIRYFTIHLSSSFHFYVSRIWLGQYWTESIVFYILQRTRCSKGDNIGDRSVQYRYYVSWDFFQYRCNYHTTWHSALTQEGIREYERHWHNGTYRTIPVIIKPSLTAPYRLWYMV